MPPPPPFPYWFFRGLGNEPLMVQPFDAPRDLGWDVLDPMFVVSYLDGWLLDSEARATLYEVYATLFGRLATNVWGLGEEFQSLRPRLRQAFERQDLIVLAPRRRNAVLPGQLAPPVLVGLPKQPPSLELSHYEIVVVDELDAPLVGLTLVISTPAGTITKATDERGRVRVDGVAPGFGSATVANIEDIAVVMSGMENRQRRTAPLPDEDSSHVRVATELHKGIVLPDADPQLLMIVTRTDLTYFANAKSWILALAASNVGPWRMQQDDGSARLNLHSDARGATAVITGLEPSTPPIDLIPTISPPPVDATLWVPPDTYLVQSGDTLERLAAIYLGDSSRISAIQALNPLGFAGGRADAVVPGDRLRMPPEAVPSWVALPRLLPPSGPPPSQPAAPEWFRESVDALHDALFRHDFDMALGVLSAIPLDPPEVASYLVPAPWFEELVWRAEMMSLTLGGMVDTPTEPPEEVA